MVSFFVQIHRQIEMKIDNALRVQPRDALFGFVIPSGVEESLTVHTMRDVSTSLDMTNGLSERWRRDRGQIGIVFSSRSEKTEQCDQPDRAERQDAGKPDRPARKNSKSNQAVGGRDCDRRKD